MVVVLKIEYLPLIDQDMTKLAINNQKQVIPILKFVKVYYHIYRLKHQKFMKQFTKKIVISQTVLLNFIVN